MVIYTTKTTARIAELTAEIVGSYQSDLLPVYIFCEDKFTLSIESEIANKHVGCFNVHITSISRYIQMNLDAKTSKKTPLSKTGSALCVLNVIADKKDMLSRFGLGDRPSLAVGVYEIIAQMKSAKVTPEEIYEICKEKDMLFHSKLKDIYTIYDSYEKILSSENLLDSNNFYDLMIDIVKNDENLKRGKVIFCGFSSVTKQILNIFKAVEKINDCDFVVINGEGECYLNEVFLKLKNLFPNATIKEDNQRISDEANAIAMGMFNPEVFSKVPLYSDKVRIFESQTPYDEVETVAKRIRFEVVKNKARYKDFLIATQNPKAFEGVLKEVFCDYEIPFYIDAMTTMDDHPVIRFLIAIIDVSRFGFSTDSVLKLCSQRILCDEDEWVDFERYVYKNAISKNAFFKPFSGENIDHIEKVRQKIISLVCLFKPKGTAKSYSECAKKVLLIADVSNRLSDLCEKLHKSNYSPKADVSMRVMEKVEEVFNEISVIVNSRVLTITEFKTVLQNATCATDVSALPIYNDVVYVGDFKSVKQRLNKNLFVIGLNSEVPNGIADTAILSDVDLVKLEEYKCVVEPKIQVLNKRIRENILLTLMSFSNMLYLSFSRQDIKGQTNIRSEIIDYVSAIFAIQIRNADNSKAAKTYDHSTDIYGYMTFNSALKTFATNIDGFIEGEGLRAEIFASFYSIAKSLGYQDKLRSLVSSNNKIKGFEKEISKRLSATMIESYFACPYSCFAKYNLKLQEEEKGDIEAYEFGNIFHSLFEKVIHKIVNSADENEVANHTVSVYQKIINEGLYVRYLNKPQYFHLFRIIESQLVMMAKQMYYGYKSSSFLPTLTEAAFGDISGALYDAIELETSKGIRRISGKVDRIDTFENYFRIIDYKTGNPQSKIKPDRLYSGNNIQLFLYPNAFMDEKLTLGGAYYYKLDTQYTDNEDSDLEKKYYGKTLLREDVARASDVDVFNKGKSAVFGFSVSENRLKKSKAFLAESEMQAYVRYAKEIAKNGAEEMVSGNISPSPYEGKEGACKYCKYGGLCGYDCEVGEQNRNLSGISEDTIIQAVKK